MVPPSLPHSLDSPACFNSLQPTLYGRWRVSASEYGGPSVCPVALSVEGSLLSWLIVCCVKPLSPFHYPPGSAYQPRQLITATIHRLSATTSSHYRPSEVTPQFILSCFTSCHLSWSLVQT